MKFTQLKFARKFLFAGALVAISLSFISIDAKPSLAQNFSAQFYKNCNKTASVPEPYHLVGILAFGILGGGYILRHKIRNVSGYLNKNNMQQINDYCILSNQQSRHFSFVNTVEINQEESYDTFTKLEFQLIEPNEII